MRTKLQKVHENPNIPRKESFECELQVQIKRYYSKPNSADSSTSKSLSKVIKGEASTCSISNR